MTAPTQLATKLRLPDNIRRRAVDKLAGYEDALERAEHAGCELRNLTPPPPIPAELDPSSCGRITQDCRAAVLEYEASVAKYAQEQQLIRRFEQQANGEERSILTSGVNTLLRDLGCELKPVLAETSRLVDELGPAATASQAIQLNVTKAWQKLQDKGDHIAKLYSEADWLYLNIAPRRCWTSATPLLGAEGHCNLLHIRNLHQLFPDWHQPGLHTRQINVDGSRTRPEPWPVDDYSPDFLIWAIKADAELWIPTLPEFDELFRQLREADNPPMQPEPERQVLNQSPRSPYDRVIPTIATTQQEVPELI